MPFQDAWLSDPDFKSWVKRVEKKANYAYCSVCRSEIFLSNMGRQALKSHMSGKKHLVSAATVSGSILDFMAPTAKKDDNRCEILVPTGNNREPDFQPATSTSVCTNQKSVRSFAIKNEVTEAEIMWCLETVVTHKSLRAAEKDVRLMSRMFPDSDIAQQMQLKKDKIGYCIMFGIAPFFKAELADALSHTKFLVVGFDESINKISKNQQMDLNVRFWDSDSDMVVTRYLTSEFLGRSRALDLLAAFKKGIGKMPLDRILQISMDGPNVNWAFLKELNVELKEHSSKLLELGSCGIHIMHGAFKNGARSVTWGIESYLRGIYNVFKDSPARRALFVQYSGSKLFPLKFCGHRWLENGIVAQRAIELFPGILKFVEGVKKDRIVPTCKSYQDVIKSLDDPLLLAKLAFFKSVAGEIEPFLREYQSDDPLVPFLYTDISRTMINLCERFMKPESLLKISSLTSENVNDCKNHLLSKKVVIGFDTKKALKEVGRISEQQSAQFHEECKLFLKTLVSKLFVKSPLTYPLTRACSSISPEIISSDRGLAEQRMDKLLETLTNNGRISGTDADAAKRQYRKLARQNGTFKEYDRKRTRVDVFWRDLLRNEDKELSTVIKIVCCLSHGNANVERGFSVNAECLFENMREESVVARRQIYDAVQAKGGIDKIEISKSLVLRTRNAHSLYVEDLARRKKETQDEEQGRIQKRARDAEAKELMAKRAKVLETAQLEAGKLDEEIRRLKQ